MIGEAEALGAPWRRPAPRTGRSSRSRRRVVRVAAHLELDQGGAAEFGADVDRAVRAPRRSLPRRRGRACRGGRSAPARRGPSRREAAVSAPSMRLTVMPQPSQVHFVAVAVALMRAPCSGGCRRLRRSAGWPAAGGPCRAASPCCRARRLRGACRTRGEAEVAGDRPHLVGLVGEHEADAGAAATGAAGAPDPVHVGVAVAGDVEVDDVGDVVDVDAAGGDVGRDQGRRLRRSRSGPAPVRAGAGSCRRAWRRRRRRGCAAA